MAEYQYARYVKDGRIARITLNRPEVLNAINPDVSLELGGIWDDFEHDPDVWIAILTGEGRAFSAGNDLKATAAASAAPGGRGARQGPLPSGGFGGNTARFANWKPTIAAVNGWAMGGGLEMALACDIIVAAEEARFGLPEPRVGLFAGAGGVHRLPRHIPLKVAMGMLLTAKHIDAREAYRIGLVNEVVPLDQLSATADRWAAEILECAPLSVRGSKEAAMTGLDLPLESAMRRSYRTLELHARSEDIVEGPRAFAEKRAPRWTAR